MDGLLFGRGFYLRGWASIRGGASIRALAVRPLKIIPCHTSMLHTLSSPTSRISYNIVQEVLTTLCRKFLQHCAGSSYNIVQEVTERLHVRNKLLLDAKNA